MAFMLARQQVYLELDENMDDYDELVEIMSNAHLNNNFLSLAREVMNSLQLYLKFCWKFSNIQRGFKWMLQNCILKYEGLMYSVLYVRNC